MRLTGWLFLVLIFSHSPAFSQQVNGHWYGVGIVQYPRQCNSYLSELILRQQGTRVWGEFIYYFKDSILTVPIRGQFDKSVRTVHLNPFPVVYYQSMSASRGFFIQMQGYFKLVASKAESSLQGLLVSNAQYRYMVPDISFKLVKSNDTLPLVKEPEIIEAPKEKRVQVFKNVPVTPPPPAIVPVAPTPPKVVTAPALVIAPLLPPSTERLAIVLTNRDREQDVAKLLEVENDELRLELYDNGQVDGDSISLLLNNRMVIEKSMLDIAAIKLNIRVDTSLAYNELAMFAHNLGNFPPNSALLVLWDGKVRYEIFLNSDLNKTAILRFRKKKKTPTQ
jgi:hypothetical protein